MKKMPSVVVSKVSADSSSSVRAKIIFILFFILSILPMALIIAKAFSQEVSNMVWRVVSEPGFQIDGLPFWGENEGEFWRFPKRAQSVTPEGAWQQARFPSGGRIRFRTDTSSLAIRLEYLALPNMRNMHAFGQAGVDAYVDGHYVASVAPRKETQVEEFFFKGQERQEREITLYLPLYMGVSVKAIGMDFDASLIAPSSFAVDKPVVYYGTSITQGGCASRPGLSYQAILSRRLNIDFVNFGFSGAGKGEPEVAQVISEVSASCFVLDFAQNSKDAESLQKVYLPFIEIIRSQHPETPIVCTTPIYMAPETVLTNVHPEQPKMREVIRDAVQSRVEAGDRNIQLVEGFSLLGPEQADGFVDGVHPNDLGFYWMAEALEPHLRRILGL